MRNEQNGLLIPSPGQRMVPVLVCEHLQWTTPDSRSPFEIMPPASLRRLSRNCEFTGVCRKSVEHIRHQLRSQLEEVWASDDVHRGRIRKEVIDTILANLQVHPVSAVQYRKLLEDDEEAPAFITEPVQSGIPGLVD